MTVAHETTTSGSESHDVALHLLSRDACGYAQARPVKSPRPSTARGIIQRAVRRALPAVALLGITTACSTYSDGSMQDHESMPHTHGAGDAHGAGEAHAAGMHAHTMSGDGLASSLGGYTLDDVELRPNVANSQLRFRILGPTGAPHLQFALDQGKLLHLYVFSADLTSFHHLHPMIDSTGEWQADLPRLDTGVNHLVASFVAIAEDRSEQGLVLGADVSVEGRAHRRPLPPEQATTTVDGYRVRLDGDLLLAQPSDLGVEVTRQGRPAPLVPYLNTWAHVTAINVASLALVHLHPDTPAAAGSPAPPEVTVTATPPAPGRYRLFVEFATASGVHRAEFTRSAWG